MIILDYDECKFASNMFNRMKRKPTFLPRTREGTEVGTKKSRDGSLLCHQSPYYKVKVQKTNRIFTHSSVDSPSVFNIQWRNQKISKYSMHRQNIHEETKNQPIKTTPGKIVPYTNNRGTCNDHCPSHGHRSCTWLAHSGHQKCTRDVDTCKKKL